MRRESAISAPANAQHGVASRAQLLELGFSNGDVDRRVRSGRLHRVHHGVYAVGHRVLTVQGRWLAAVLAAGNGAVLSHASAAAARDLRPPLEQLIDRADQRGLVNFDVLRTATPASLHAVLDGYAPAPTRSELEERFLRVCDAHGILRPDTTALIDGYEVDFVWRARRGS